MPWLHLLAVGMGGAILASLGLLSVLPIRQGAPGVRAFAAILLGIVAWTGLYGLILLPSLAGSEATLVALSTVLQASLAVLWLLFALQYTGRTDLVTPRTVALIALPVGVTLGLALTNEAHGLVFGNFRLVETAGASVPQFDFGPWYLIMIGFAYTLIGAGLAILIEYTREHDLFVEQTVALLFAVCFPAAMRVKEFLALPPLPAVDLTPVAFGLTVPVLGYVFFRHGLFSVTPAARRAADRAAVEDHAEAVAIVDEGRRIIAHNERLDRLVGPADRDLLERDLEAVLDHDVFDLEGTEPAVRLETNEGHRAYSITTSPVSGLDGDVLGYRVVLHDVTDRKQRRQRLEVLNRILRHNLRNTMTAIVGYARRLEEQVEDGDWMIDRIEDQSTRLIELSEKAREIDRLTDPSRDRSAFHLDDCFEDVRSSLEGEYPNLTVTVHVPGSLSITSDRVIVEEIIRYGAQSLETYNESDRPRVVLSATPTDARGSWIDVSITHDGPPIPEEERAVVEQGSETPLEHSRDLDLWLVTWGVETLGGDLSFLDSDGGRAGLRLSIPDVERVPGERRPDESDATES